MLVGVDVGPGLAVYCGLGVAWGPEVPRGVGVLVGIGVGPAGVGTH
ncbi:MAG: hypothetical protein M1358_13100 [Chloroflexi bacterium]|nr:hypothetical protein [Chloroflexota bacterium]